MMTMCRPFILLQLVWSLSTVFTADAFTSPRAQYHNLHAGLVARFEANVDAGDDSSSIAVLNRGTPDVEERREEGQIGDIATIKDSAETTAVKSTTQKDLVTSTPVLASLDQDATNNVESSEENSKGAFALISSLAAACLWESDMRRDAKGLHSGLQASSATNWINDATAFALQKSVDKIKIKLAEERTGLDRDEASSWLRWMRSSPQPLIVDFSKEIRSMVNETMSNKRLEMIELTRSEFLDRIGCRLILLPSGSALNEPLTEPPASLIYGKLLYGGAERYRRLVSSNSKRPPRKAGERTDIMASANDNVPAWIQYGGAERMYEAVDMGSAGILEFILLPRGKKLPDTMSHTKGDMVIGNMAWSPENIFVLAGDDDVSATRALDEFDFVTGYTPMSLAGSERNKAFESDFRSSVGGLQKEIDAIVRRVLDGRVLRPAQEGVGNGGDQKDVTETAMSMAAMEAEELAILGLTPVRGLLLYGPPGCGKTALAREIAKALRARAPKIVSAPELLDRWVGGSEKLVRGLFADAEAELAACNGDATKSALHVIVIDEIDAVFRRRSSGEDSGEATRASVVNQILSKMDGINSIDNVLLIGMTNRRELLDEALLRPGRLEVQIEIPLPDREGRREILQIHFDALRRNGRLSKPLCCAIEGVANDTSLTGKRGVNLESGNMSDGGIFTRGRKRRAVKRVVTKVLAEASSVVRPPFDLAADSSTAGFSGADIAGLVRCAGSIALSRARKDGSGVDGLLITLEDVKEALKEIRK